MLRGMLELARTIERANYPIYNPTLFESDAALLDPVKVGAADLIVTSPPYPGIHMLYHRWQVDGRRESNAPYWLAACRDGSGASHYCFAARSTNAEDTYFARALPVFSAIRPLLKPSGLIVQMVAFSEPRRQLRRYLNMMEASGFIEVRERGTWRLRRDVPGRRWHARCQGKTHGSREVVLAHAPIR
jgi:DNA modification methylase